MSFLGIFTAITTAFSRISTAAISLAKNLAPFVGKAIQGLISIINPLAESFSVKPKGMPMEEFGDRAAQMDQAGKTRKDFESDKDYLDALENYDLDPKLSAQTDLNEKTALGVSYSVIGLSEKYDTNIEPLVFLALNNEGLYDKEKFEKYVQMSSELGFSLADLSKYYSGDLTGRQTEMEECIRKTEKSLDPTVSDEKITDFINRQVELD